MTIGSEYRVELGSGREEPKDEEKEEEIEGDSDSLEPASSV